MQTQSSITVVISSGILRPIGNQVGETQAQGVALHCIATVSLSPSRIPEQGAPFNRARPNKSCEAVSAMLAETINHIPSSFHRQVTLSWALLFAALGVMCRIPGVLYQSSKAGIACGRVFAHVCLVKVGWRE